MGPSSPGGIPWTVVMAWADRHEYDGDEADTLDRLVREMDAEYLDWWREDAERAAREAKRK